MTSWRDQTSETAQRTLDDLLNAALGFAQNQLANRGEFVPYAVAVPLDGELTLFNADPTEGGEHPESTDVLAACLAGLTNARETLCAAAVVADVRIPDGDAIRVDLEHREGRALRVMLPYSKKRFSRGVEYGQLQASEGVKQIWT